MPGKLIVLEGVDGLGKTEQYKHILPYLKEQGYQIEGFREPGGTPAGERIREILLDRKGLHLLPATEACLFTAARIELVETKIKPALASGKHILLDRYSPSTEAYQGRAGNVPEQFIDALVDFATNGAEPNGVFVLDAPPGFSYKRSQEDRIEQKGLEFREKVVEAYREYARKVPYAQLIDARTGIADPQKSIKVMTERLLKHILPILDAS